MPTPKTWTDRAADILLDERNKRYLGMTEPTNPGAFKDAPVTAAGRAPADRLAEAVRQNLIAGVRAQSGKITDDEFDDTTREVIAALQAYDEAAADLSGLLALLDKAPWRDENEGCAHHYGNLTYPCSCTVPVEEVRAALTGASAGGDRTEGAATPPASDEWEIGGKRYKRVVADPAPPASGPLTPERLMEASAFFGAVITYQQARSILARLTADASASGQEAEG